MNAKTKRIIKICIPVLIAIAIIVAGVIFISTYEPYNKASISKDPKAQLIKSFNKTMDVLEEGMAFQIPDHFLQSFEQGSIEAVLKGSNGTDISNTVYLRDEGFTMTGSVSQGKEDSMTYGIYADKNNLAVDFPAVLKDTIYGIQTDSIKEDLKDSDLLKVLNLEYDEAVQIIEAIKQMLPNKDEKLRGKDWISLTNMKLRLKTLLDGCEVSVSDGTLATNMGGQKVYRVSYTMTPAQMCEGIDIIYNWLITTEFFNSFIDDTPITADDLKAKVEEMKANIVSSNATAIANFYLHEKTQVIIQAEFRLDWFEEEGKPATFLTTVKLGENPLESIKYSADFSLKMPDESTERVTLIYERSHAHNLPGRKLIVSYDDEETVVMELQVNSITNAFNLSLFNNKVKLSGVCKSENGKVYVTTTIADVGDLSLTFTGTAEAPKMPEYTNICTVSELDLLRMFIKYLPEREAEITVEMPDGVYWDTHYITHQTCTLGELLQEYNLATVDENGRIVSVIDYEPPVADVEQTWDVYLNGVLVTESLFDVIMDYEAEISIRDVTQYPEEEPEDPDNI